MPVPSGSIDITAADRLELLYRSLNKKNIRFYITEHIADLNGQMRKLGLGYLIEEGCVRRTIHIALKDMGNPLAVSAGRWREK